MKLRKYDPKDVNQIVEIFYDTVHSINAQDYNEDQLWAWAPEKNPKAFSRLIQQITYVVDLEEQIVGFGSMKQDGVLDCLYTHKDHQGQGVAKLIYMQLEHDARELGLLELISEVSISAKPAAERAGFEVVKAQEVLRRGVLLKNYLMKKRLLEVP